MGVTICCALDGHREKFWGPSSLGLQQGGLGSTLGCPARCHAWCHAVLCAREWGAGQWGHRGGSPGLGAVAGLRTGAGLGPASRWQQYLGGHWGHWGQCHMALFSCKAGSPFGIPVRPLPALHPVPHPPFPCLAPSHCPDHPPCPGAGSLLLASGSLVAHSWLAVPGCWLSAGGQCRGDSRTRSRGASWAGRRSSLQPHFWVGSQTLLC